MGSTALPTDGATVDHRTSRRQRAGHLVLLSLSVWFGLALSSQSLEASSTASPPSPLTPLEQVTTQAENALRQDEPQQADSAYRDVLLESWLLRGGLDVLDQDWQAAETAYQTASSVALETHRAQVSLALVLLQQGKSVEAINRLRRVVSQRPDDPRPRRQLAQALVAAGRPDEAVEELVEALAIQPEDAETAFALAAGYVRQNNLKDAEAQFERVRALRPLAQTDVLIGRIYRDARFFDPARQALRAALEADPTVPRAHYYLATILLLEGGRDVLEQAMERLHQELEHHPNEALTHLYLGMALTESQRYAESLPHLDVALRQSFTRLDGLRFSGRSLLRLDRLDEAIPQLEEALELAVRAKARPSQLATIAYQLGQAWRRSGDEDNAQHYFTQAETFNDALIEADRDNFERLVANNLELESFDALELPSEAKLLQGLSPQQRQALRGDLHQSLARAYFNLGVLVLRGAIPTQHQHQRAANLFGRAAEIAPEYPQVQFSWGASLFNSDRFDDAVAPLERALSAEPQRPDVRRMLAMACLNSHRYERAATLLADDTERSEQRELQYAYALALVRSGQPDAAGAIFDQLLAQHDDWAALHVLSAQAHAQRENYPAAFDALTEALRLDPKVADAHETRGNMYLRQGLLEEAEASLLAELELQPQDHQSRYLLATTLDLNRQTERAQEELRHVLLAQPRFADARYLLGKILLAEGEAAEARIHLQAAAELAPEDPNIFYQLGQANQRLGKVDAARQHFETYQRLKKAEREVTP